VDAPKKKYLIEECRYIQDVDAVPFIHRIHYSKVMPRHTKAIIGGFNDGQLVAVMTLGYGTAPLHTIRKLFPSLTTKDYFEIGKLCMLNELPKNSESYFMARCIKMLKRDFPDRKVLFTWADGVIGKPGYVYQGSNFYYGGYIWASMYMTPDGVKVHERSLQGKVNIPGRPRSGKFMSLSYEYLAPYGFTRYSGLLFRYVYPLCSPKEWERLRAESSVKWEQGNYPKDPDCKWKKQIAKGKMAECEMPIFKRGAYVKASFGQMGLPGVEGIGNVGDAKIKGGD
jgi:hypothetical protein